MCHGRFVSTRTPACGAACCTGSVGCEDVCDAHTTCVITMCPADTLTPTVRLRLLATSDLHAHLLAWDYHADRASDAVGLVRVAGLMAKARAEVANCLYFDNGDLIEGSPLGDHQALSARRDRAGVHPMVAGLNALGCDAATLGNHEFSYGVPFLRSVLAGAAYPVVCANMLLQQGASPDGDLPMLPPYVILERRVVDICGAQHEIRIGVFGLTPPQVLQWDGAQIAGQLQARDMLEAAAHVIPRIRSAGADLVVALAHTGIGSDTPAGGGENVGLSLAGVPGIDALILGHEHQVFPSAGFAGLDCADAAAGTMRSVPTVMPGTYGSHLGIIDLDLRRSRAGWHVIAARSEARPISRRDAIGTAAPLVADDPALARLAAPAHQSARRWMGRRVGHAARPLHSYFALVHDCVMQRVIADAQARHLRRILAATDLADLPVLSAVAPFKTGGRGGPDHFTDVPAGSLLLRHVTDLYMFPNTFAAIVLTGDDVARWLETSVSAYAQLRPGVQDQPLMNPAFPGFGVEMIAGLTYRIDLTAPARYDLRGHMAAPAARRIRDLRFEGARLDPAARFAVATNSYRAAVVAGQMSMPPQIIAGGGESSRDVLLDHIAAHDSIPAPPPAGWSFVPVRRTSVTYDTAPAARQHLADIPGFAPQPLGLTETGFLRFRLHL